MRRTSPLQLCWSEPNLETLAKANRRTGKSVIGLIYNVMASIPGCFESFWESVESAFDSSLIRSAAGEMCRLASVSAGETVHFQNHLAWLSEYGFKREDSRQIRYVVEAFHCTEPVFAILAAVALNWIQGCGRLRKPDIRNPDHKHSSAVFTGPIEYVDQCEDLDCLIPVMDRIGVPVHPFFSALAVWPEYLETVWSELEPILDRSDYSDAVTAVDSALDILSRGVPMPECRISPNMIKPDFVSSIQHCIDTSCEVIILSSALRRMFVKAETQARARRMREAAV